jgi:peptidoglycan/xylan/chitin deacetylase (PgdA/CDA1 family)
MKILFRYDDFSEISHNEVDIAVLETITSAGFTPLVGVIPAIADVNWDLGSHIPLKRLSSPRIQLLKNFLPNKIEIALHGYTHQAVTRFSGLFEFGNAVDINRQIERLLDGKKILEDAFGTTINWFIPPWNAYGSSTLKAMKAAKLRGISGDATFGPTDNDTFFAPATCLIHEIYLLAAFDKKNVRGDAIVVLHDYDFKESGSPEAKISIEGFKQILENLKKTNIKKETFSNIIGDQKWGSARALANQSLRKQTNGPLQYFQRPGSNCLYWDKNVAQQRFTQSYQWGRLLKTFLNSYRKIFSKSTLP